MKKNNKKILFKISLIILSGIILISALNLIFPLPQLKNYSTEILAHDGTLLTSYLTEDEKWRMQSSLDEVSPELIKALVEKEDKYFFWHFGINPISIFKAFYSNIVNGKITSGASTITMQLARIWEPAERTYKNKIIEMIRAVQIELNFSKKEILELYLNYLPYGGNIEGVKAASYIYFNHPPNKLSLAQAVLLAVIPNDPNNLRVDRSVILAKQNRNKWLNKFKRDNLFNDNILDDALSEPLESNRFEIPKLALHFCMRVKKLNKKPQFISSLDLTKQKTSEKLLSNYVNRVKNQNVSNGSVLVIDNTNNNVIVYCGSADFFDNKSAGQVDGINSIRSPGSTLKPFLYAQAFDKGILTPKMKLLDIPMDFSGYEPENFDNKFNGEVTAEFALMNSLNVPAVQLLQKINIHSFLQNLQKAGFDRIYNDKEKLGLSLILGGCGTTLEELVRGYSSFANNGIIRQLNFEGDKLIQNGTRIYSEASSYLIAKILSNIERPDFPNTFIGETKLPKFAWKTGTSYGKRDAWAIGINPRFTIGVWLGNFNGEGSPYLSGAEMAVPLLFDLFNSIDYDSDKKWFDIPYEILEREVCAETGLIPNHDCKNLINDYYIENVSTHKNCDRYKTLMVDESETIEFCPDCLAKNKYKKIAYPIYDGELKLWFEKNNINYNKPPQHNPKCTHRLAEKGPKIVSPMQNYDYYLEKKSDQKILLQAVSSANVLSQYWYINDEFYEKCKPGEKVFFRPENENVKIICSDDKGGMSNLKINVKFY